MTKWLHNTDNYDFYLNGTPIALKTGDDLIDGLLIISKTASDDCKYWIYNKARNSLMQVKRSGDIVIFGSQDNYYYARLPDAKDNPKLHQAS